MDTNRERLYEALINREYTVCHVALRPYCLWHALNLKRVGSPFVEGGRVRRQDLLIAVWICQTAPFATAAEMAPRLPEKPFATAREIAKFRAYRRDYGQPYKKCDGTGSPVQVPWEAAVAARLCLLGGKTEAEAWAMPFGRALQFATELGEANGGNVKLISDDDEVAMRKAYPEDDDAG